MSYFNGTAQSGTSCIRYAAWVLVPVIHRLVRLFRYDSPSRLVSSLQAWSAATYGLGVHVETAGGDFIGA